MYLNPGEGIGGPNVDLDRIKEELSEELVEMRDAKAISSTAIEVKWEVACSS